MVQAACHRCVTTALTVGSQSPHSQSPCLPELHRQPRSSQEGNHLSGNEGKQPSWQGKLLETCKWSCRRGILCWAFSVMKTNYSKWGGTALGGLGVSSNLAVSWTCPSLLHSLILSHSDTSFSWKIEINVSVLLLVSPTTSQVDCELGLLPRWSHSSLQCDSKLYAFWKRNTAGVMLQINAW